jgi:hypothetical protein
MELDAGCRTDFRPIQVELVHQLQKHRWSLQHSQQYTTAIMANSSQLRSAVGPLMPVLKVDNEKSLSIQSK